MNIYALQTARAGSKSVKSKNTMYFDDKNYGVRSDKFDRLFGTRRVFLDRKDI